MFFSWGTCPLTLRDERSAPPVERQMWISHGLLWSSQNSSLQLLRPDSLPPPSRLRPKSCRLRFFRHSARRFHSTTSLWIRQTPHSDIPSVSSKMPLSISSSTKADGVSHTNLPGVLPEERKYGIRGPVQSGRFPLQTRANRKRWN